MVSEAASWREPKAIVAVEVNIPMRDKGKRKIVDHMEEEKSCKFREDPLIEKVAMAIEVKTQYHSKRNAQRNREK